MSDVAELIMLAMEHNLKTPGPAGFERFYLYVSDAHHQSSSLNERPFQR